MDIKINGVDITDFSSTVILDSNLEDFMGMDKAEVLANLGEPFSEGIEDYKVMFNISLGDVEDASMESLRSLGSHVRELGFGGGDTIVNLTTASEEVSNVLMSEVGKGVLAVFSKILEVVLQVF